MVVNSILFSITDLVNETIWSLNSSLSKDLLLFLYRNSPKIKEIKTL